MRTIIFDVDGVILDSMKIWEDLSQRLLLTKGIKPKDSLSEDIYTMNIDQALEFMIEDYNIDDTKENLKKIIMDILEEFYLKEVKLKKGVREFLERAKDYKKIVLTTGDINIVKKTFERLKIDNKFDYYFDTNMLSIGKDDPRIYKLIEDITDSKIEDMILIEDSSYALKTAKKLGIYTIGVKDSDNDIDKYSDEVVEDLLQIKSI
ncbi:MAG: HAD family phosphatase [Tissierellia bacterium]|nr:HAD family phosphatase [Tissierellia bacterium]